ncbi:MAG TPA: zinc-binding dehydrogenase [Arachidicoccus sp.]|nr:zinc-binding dehydrogenase [Arachidicoccus sp.]
MEDLMKAICLSNEKSVEIQEIPRPQRAQPGHLLIKMLACGINAGDIAFIGGAFPKGSIPVSLYDIRGVSGVGTVMEVGEGVSPKYNGRNVAIYRSLKFDDDIIGTWCETAHMHYQQCVILPDSVNMEDYAGSLVNIITPFAFFKQITEEGHKGIICTAGNSATGIAMLGICLAKDFPVISIVRTEEGKKELEALGAKNIVVQIDSDFNEQLKQMSDKFVATAVFDGVGGIILNRIKDVLPLNTTIYCYGFLGGDTGLSFHTSLLMKGITIKGFGNFRSKTVQNSALLEEALNDISALIDMPHFKTKAGKHFSFEEINEALVYTSTDGKKAILYPYSK